MLNNLQKYIYLFAKLMLRFSKSSTQLFNKETGYQFDDRCVFFSSFLIINKQAQNTVEGLLQKTKSLPDLTRFRNFR